MGQHPDVTPHKQPEPFSVQHSEILCLIGFHATAAANLASAYNYGHDLDRHLERIQDWAGVLEKSNAHTGTKPNQGA